MGGDVIRAPTADARQDLRDQPQRQRLFRGLNGPFEATRYHSLIVERDSCPAALKVTAATDDGVIMGLQHRTVPVHGVQFHPESIASENGHALLQNFLNIARDWNRKRSRAARDGTFKPFIGKIASGAADRRGDARGLRPSSCPAKRRRARSAPS